MKNKEGFQCSACGECCRHIGKIEQLRAFNNGNGVCIHLKGNLCEIYENRPEICRVDDMYEKYFSNYYSREEFYEINKKACEEIKKGKFD